MQAGQEARAVSYERAATVTQVQQFIDDTMGQICTVGMGEALPLLREAR